MRKESSGFILLITLCIILIANVLLITCLRHLLLYHKALNQQEFYHQNFYQLEYTAKQLARIFSTAMANKNCVETQDAANKVIGLLTEGRGCFWADEQMQYRYIIEDLGEFPCLVLYKQQQKQSTHHIRVSLLLLANGQHGASLLQLRFIKAAAPASCLEEEHAVNEGISSWRYLSTLDFLPNRHL